MANKRYSEVHPEVAKEGKAGDDWKVKGEDPTAAPKPKDTEAPTRDALKKLPKVKGKE